MTWRDSVSAALDHLCSLWGGVDVVVNNAGVSDTKSVLNYNDSDWDIILDTNLKGAWIVAQEAARRMVNAGSGGNIVNITSILGNRVGGGVGPYSAAKAGLAHLTRSMALELARHRSEEHTSELQSRPHLVCRLLLEKKKTQKSSVHEVLRA